MMGSCIESKKLKCCRYKFYNILKYSTSIYYLNFSYILYSLCTFSQYYSFLLISKWRECNQNCQIKAFKQKAVL